MRSAFLPATPAVPAPSLFGPMNPPVRDWSGRPVWVVGASSGIGAELARGLQRRGARVAASARRADALRDAMAPGAAQPPAAGAAAHAPVEIVPLDVTDAAAVAAACSGLRARWGGIDLVLWVAGTYTPMRASDFLEGARRMVDTNLGAVMSGLAAVLPMLLAQGGGGLAIVSSVAGYSGLPQALVYGPTKAALINLAESLYLDLRPAGIGVYLVNPGYVDTPATASNPYPMPALITARQAADATIAGIEAGRFEIHYPKRFTRWLKLGRLLPYRLYFPLVHRVTGL